MSSIIGRSAFRASRSLRSTFQSTRPRWQEAPAASSADREAGREALRKGARRDPELYILLGIMSCAFGLAGWHFSRNPTTHSSEANIAKAHESEPWKTGRSSVYMYHPGGDTSNPPKDAPSALNEVIIPNVNLPKSLHEQFNKYGKEGY